MEQYEELFKSLFKQGFLVFHNYLIKFTKNPSAYLDLLFNDDFYFVTRWRITKQYAYETLELAKFGLLVNHYEQGVEKSLAAFAFYTEDHIYLIASCADEKIKIGLLLRWMLHYHLKQLGVRRITTKPSVKKLLRYYQDLGYRKIDGTIETELSSEELSRPPRFSVSNEDEMFFDQEKSYPILANYSWNKINSVVKEMQKKP